MPAKTRVLRRAVFLDRDGVVNRALLKDGRPLAPRSIKEFKLLPKVAQAVKDLRRAGFLVIVATNQPDVGAGKQSRASVEKIHARLRRTVVLDGFKVCYHTDEDACDCRKPKPGMLLEAASELKIDLKHSFMVGDRWRDIEAGKSAGCRTVWIRSQYKERPVENPDAVGDSLYEASRLILLGKVKRKGK